MRNVRAWGSSPIESLSPVLGTLDNCWWYLGGQGFNLTSARSLDPSLTPRMELIDQYLELNPQVGGVGRPGFFSHLGKSLYQNWSCYFAIEGDSLPLDALLQVKKVAKLQFKPFENLPQEVLLALRDVDGGYEEYGFRDDWMFESVLKHLRYTMHRRAEEILVWPALDSSSSIK